jgi:hypothetical protein
MELAAAMPAVVSNKRFYKFNCKQLKQSKLLGSQKKQQQNMINFLGRQPDAIGARI